MAIRAKVKYMKIKLLIVLITFAALAILSIAGFYVYKFLNQPSDATKLPEVNLVINNKNTNNGETSGQKTEDPLEETRIVKEEFEMTLPAGWQEADTPPEGIWLMAIDAKEDVSGGAFQKLDFRTNFSVKSDDITRYASINSFEDYVSSVKTSLTQTITGISFGKEEQKTVNGLPAIFIECASRQEDADFKTLLVFIKASDNIVYAVSFNAFLDSWEAYKDSFYLTAESFKLKYNIELQ